VCGKVELLWTASYHVYIKNKEGKNRIQVMITIILNEYLSSEIINAFWFNFTASGEM
jgi:hypothetical protein